ncbi:MAG: hypothetical protein Q8L87_16015 [Anaerolineales bacterium]|jgi:hypothetical protein|nr:hypothetical protein [Anaerolineales bacterium]
MSKWLFFNQGRTIGTTSAEGGLILSDEELDGSARITLKRGKGHVSVSLIIYGWIDHTRFFTTDSDAQREYRAMKPAIAAMLNIIKMDDARDIKIWEAISDFVRRFP